MKHIIPILLITCLFSSVSLADTSSPLQEYTCENIKVSAGFVPDKTEIFAGEPLTFTEHILNTGQQALVTDAVDELQSYNFNISIVPPAGATITHFPGPGGCEQLGGFADLKPGDELIEHGLATEYVEIKAPGIYTFQCEKLVALAPEGILPESNFIVKPGKDAIDIVSIFTIKVDPCDKVKLGEMIDKLGDEALHPVYSPKAEHDVNPLRILVSIDDPRVVPWLKKITASTPDWAAARAIKKFQAAATTVKTVN
jgi:hypothetical protein